jgi:hypothetical protein
MHILFPHLKKKLKKNGYSGNGFNSKRKKKQLDGRIDEKMFLLFDYIFDKCKWWWCGHFIILNIIASFMSDLFKGEFHPLSYCTN